VALYRALAVFRIRLFSVWSKKYPTYLIYRNVNQQRIRVNFTVFGDVTETRIA